MKAKQNILLLFFRSTAAASSGSSSRPPYTRSMSLSPSRIDEFKYRQTVAPVRTLIRDSFRDEGSAGGRGLNGHSSANDHGHMNVRHVRRSPSVAKERTRDELIDSIVHTRTREHRVMPGFHSASDWEERKVMGIDCDKVIIMIQEKCQREELSSFFGTLVPTRPPVLRWLYRHAVPTNQASSAQRSSNEF